ncbi:hypothetical protein [Pseudaeromonas paramecii]|uniref:Uncharacterized protein n=1 Tax=Pseudaeromonas paramecii TaxID=2138166 RepID=A0ABP8QDS8_9GAMM
MTKIISLLVLASSLSISNRLVACTDALSLQSKIEALLNAHNYAEIDELKLSTGNKQQGDIECIDSVVNVLMMKAYAHAKLGKNHLAKEEALEASRILEPYERTLYDGMKLRFAMAIILQQIEFNLDPAGGGSFSEKLLEDMSEFIESDDNNEPYPLLWQIKEMYVVASNLYAHKLINGNDCHHALQVIKGSEHILPQDTINEFKIGIERKKLKQMCDR